MDHQSEASQLLKRSLDAFLSKDMKAWSELCDENVVVEFPFAPEGSPSKLEGRQAIYEYLSNLDAVAKASGSRRELIRGCDTTHFLIKGNVVDDRYASPHSA